MEWVYWRSYGYFFSSKILALGSRLYYWPHFCLRISMPLFPTPPSEWLPHPISDQDTPIQSFRLHSSCHWQWHCDRLATHVVVGGSTRTSQNADFHPIPLSSFLNPYCLGTWSLCQLVPVFRPGQSCALVQLTLFRSGALLSVGRPLPSLFQLLCTHKTIRSPG